MTFPVNGNIPGPNDLLSQSQGQIQTNFSNILGWSGVDHIEYGAMNAGEHAQLNFPSNGILGTYSGLESGVVTAAGEADSSKSQLFFKNSLATFPISPIKAMAAIVGTGIVNGYNITSVTNPSTGLYQITMSITLPGIYLVLITPSTPSGGGYPNVTASYVILSGSQFNILTQDTKNSVGIAVPSFSVVVLQV